MNHIMFVAFMLLWLKKKKYISEDTVLQTEKVPSEEQRSEGSYGCCNFWQCCSWLSHMSINRTATLLWSGKKKKSVVARWLHLHFFAVRNQLKAGMVTNWFPKAWACNTVSFSGRPLSITWRLHRSPGGKQPVSKQLQSDLDWLQSLSDSLVKVCK